MTTEYLFEDPEHFEEGLVHLADMLELADPRRLGAVESQAKVKQTGVSVPTGESFDNWHGFCQEVLKSLRATRPSVESEERLATLDATVDRIEQMIQ